MRKRRYHGKERWRYRGKGAQIQDETDVGLMKRAIPWFPNITYISMPSEITINVVTAEEFEAQINQGSGIQSMLVW